MHRAAKVATQRASLALLKISDHHWLNEMTIYYEEGPNDDMIFSTDLITFIVSISELTLEPFSLYLTLLRPVTVTY